MPNNNNTNQQVPYDRIGIKFQDYYHPNVAVMQNTQKQEHKVSVQSSNPPNFIPNRIVHRNVSHAEPLNQRIVSKSEVNKYKTYTNNVDIQNDVRKYSSQTPQVYAQNYYGQQPNIKISPFSTPIKVHGGNVLPNSNVIKEQYHSNMSNKKSSNGPAFNMGELVLSRVENGVEIYRYKNGSE